MLQWKFLSLSKTLPTTQINAAIHSMSDLCELDIDIFELNFWYQVHFCAFVICNFFQTWRRIYLFIYFFWYGAFIQKQRNGIHR